MFILGLLSSFRHVNLGDSLAMSGTSQVCFFCSPWSTANIYLLFVNENIAVVCLTAQFHACSSWCHIIVGKKLCTHRLGLFGADYCWRMCVETFCNRWQLISLLNIRHLHAECDVESGTVGAASGFNWINDEPVQTSTSNLFATLCVSSW